MVRISTQNLSQMPEISALKRILQALSVLDLVFAQDWVRSYRFDAHWSANSALGSMNDGSGNHFFCLFTDYGAILKGFDHESPMSPFRVNPPKIWPGILETVPKVFDAFLSEPAFVLIETTYCVWRLNNDPQWNRGKSERIDGEIPDGSEFMLFHLDDNPYTYHSWAERNFERSISIEAVKKVYAHEPLTQALVEQLNPIRPIESILNEIAEVGYPTPLL